METGVRIVSLARGSSRAAWPACALARLGWCPVARRWRRAVPPSNGLAADACPRVVVVTDARRDRGDARCRAACRRRRRRCRRRRVRGA
jgi:hypothetical protein